MPRAQFRLASDADTRDVDCISFVRDDHGRPMCTALKHPYCLACGAKPCAFCVPYDKEVAACPSQNA